MKDYRSLSHTKWDCKYHVVFIPKCRRKRIFGKLRGHLGEILHELAKQKQSRIVEGHLRPDHVHMCISIPPKFSVSSVVGFIKGKSAISIATKLPGSEAELHRGTISGRGGTSFLRSVSTRLWSVNTFATKRRKTSGWNSSTSIGRARSWISKTAPFEGLTEISPRLCRG